MENRLAYLLAVVAVGWAVTFFLRALPFLAFAGRGRALPPWVERFGNISSPVIIAGLIVYSYSGLEWKTAWPYLAGVLTVGLQLWRHNALVSIIVGTVVYMCMLNCGCVSDKVMELDSQHPAVTVKTSGVYFGEERVEPFQVPEILKDAGISRQNTIHIMLEQDVRDLRDARATMGCLARSGYRRSVLVTKRHAESVKVDQDAKLRNALKKTLKRERKKQ